MLFRTEDTEGFKPNSREYDPNEFDCPIIDKSKVDTFIAQKIREQLNGHKIRSMWSYSKSLATCLLKYNKFTDNGLHIFRNNGYLDHIIYDSPAGKTKSKDYSLEDRLDDTPLFKKPGKIRLLHFAVDVSDNDLVNAYLRKYTGVGLKKVASPEKDSEVVVMNPSNDTVIKEYLDSVYVLYGLQRKYNFLNDADICEELIGDLQDVDEIHFDYCPEERAALIELIRYLSWNWREESQISRGIYKYSEDEFHPSVGYDPILQFDGILKDDFEMSLHLSDYNGNVVSELFWKYCEKHLIYDV